jgi:hypothetical protein
MDDRQQHTRLVNRHQIRTVQEKLGSSFRNKMFNVSGTVWVRGSHWSDVLITTNRNHLHSYSNTPPNSPDDCTPSTAFALSIFRLTSQLLIDLQNWMSKMLICRFRLHLISLVHWIKAIQPLDNAIQPFDNPDVRSPFPLISLPHQIPV